MRTIILGLGLLIAMSAYADTQSKSWYVAHPASRARVNAICMDNPGQAKTNANCINAAAADEIAAIDRMTANSNTATLFDRCADMPPLFQQINHCGGRR